VSEFEVQIGGEVKNFRPEEVIPTKDLRRMDKNGQYAVVSALEAVADAGLIIDDTNRDDVGVIYGSAGGGYGLLLEQNEIFVKSGYRRVSPFLISNMLPDAASGHIAITLGACGPNMAVVSACSTATGAIGESWETIRRGDAEAVITGGTDNPLLPVLLAGFHALRALANDPEHPDRACKPFDARRDGFVVGQGAASLVLESLEHAQARGAEICAEVIGYAASNDAYDMVASLETGRASAVAMTRAMRKAGIARDGDAAE
jgi:3-oxoacyl-(acyl-carrier-protein) synthase